MKTETRALIAATIVFALTALTVAGCTSSKKKTPQLSGPEGPCDLVVLKVTAPSSANRGASIAVSDVVTNQSALYAAPTTWTCLYMNTSPTTAGASNLGSHSTPILNPRTGVLWNGNVTVPSGQPTGQNYYIVVCNCTSTASETNPNNNTNYVAVTIN